MSGQNSRMKKTNEMNKRNRNNNNKGKKNNESKKSLFTLKSGMFTLFWISIIVCTCTVVFSQINTYYEYCAQEEELAAKFELETLRRQELVKSKDYYNSDAYIEKAAREHLGLVMPDEILFYNDSKN